MITFCPRCGAEYGEVPRGDWVDTGLPCVDCGLSIGKPPSLLVRSDTEEEVEYDLGEWAAAERSAATTALLAVDIPYRWESGLVLVVPAVAEEEVDRLLDDLDEVDELDEREEGDERLDGGEEAHQAMTDLFVAADRLQHAPTDAGLAGEVLDAASVVGSTLPPYGIDRPVWRKIQGLASTVATDLEEAADEDTVAADARALREYLRDLV